MVLTDLDALEGLNSRAPSAKPQRTAEGNYYRATRRQFSLRFRFTFALRFWLSHVTPTCAPGRCVPARIAVKTLGSNPTVAQRFG